MIARVLLGVLAALLTRSGPAVAERTRQFQLLQIDVTRNTDTDKAFLKRPGIFGPPAILFFDTAGNELARAARDRLPVGRTLQAHTRSRAAFWRGSGAMSKKLGANSTPTWFLRNGDKHQGAVPMSKLVPMLDAAARAR